MMFNQEEVIRRKHFSYLAVLCSAPILPKSLCSARSAIYRRIYSDKFSPFETNTAKQLLVYACTLHGCCFTNIPVTIKYCEETVKSKMKKRGGGSLPSTPTIPLCCTQLSLVKQVNRLDNEGYYGGVRLLMATCKVFTNYCKENGIHLHNINFSLSYDTNIPRQQGRSLVRTGKGPAPPRPNPTGLSGSSAIVCVAFSCLLDFYNVWDKIAVEIRPQLILNAEKELGIVAGLQDRVAQVYGGLVDMDFNKEMMSKHGHGNYTPLDTSFLPPLHLIYAENPSGSGKVHSPVRQRCLDGDKFIISSMEEVANLALQGKTALLEMDYAKLATLMNQNFDLRRSLKHFWKPNGQLGQKLITGHKLFRSSSNLLKGNLIRFSNK